MTLPPRSIVVPFALACLPVHGCTQVDKGAVEVSWSLYTDNGATTDCTKNHIEQVVLYWRVAADDGTQIERHAIFPCDDRHGVTSFEVTPGTASLWLKPDCKPGVPIDDTRFEAPPPIVRTITAGEVVTLETQLLQLQPDVCP